MYYVMMLDTMGKQYGLLPSECLARASTIDLYVLEKAIAYHNLPRDKDGKIIKPPKRLSQAEMMAMLQQVKDQQNGTKAS